MEARLRAQVAIASLRLSVRMRPPGAGGTSPLHGGAQKRLRQEEAAVVARRPMPGKLAIEESKCNSITIRSNSSNDVRDKTVPVRRVAGSAALALVALACTGKDEVVPTTDAGLTKVTSTRASSPSVSPCSREEEHEPRLAPCRRACSALSADFAPSVDAACAFVLVVSGTTAPRGESLGASTEKPR